MVGEILAPLMPQLQLLSGKKVWEVLPSEITGKGGAVRAQMASIAPSTLPIYIGDDVSDESAFAQLKPGLTVRVGPSRRSAARYRLRDPQEVRRFLERMVLEVT
jgi:trehalose 6-phosphate phosphatase